VNSLPDAERDACDVLQALAGLAAVLARPLPGEPHDDEKDRRALEDARRVMLSLAQDGGESAQRVVAYLRSLQGPGDGASASVSPRLGPWRNWVPPRGNLFGNARAVHHIGDSGGRRRADPGE
jgi:hypothetical protein